jgi:hypothetical protein
VVLLLLPLSLAIDDGEYYHNGGVGDSGSLAAAAALAVAAVEDNWRQKQLALLALTVA